MITVPTVFILGAGANVDYGFPTGVELKSEICRPINVTDLSDPRNSTISVNELQRHGIDSDAYRAFQKELMSSALSVDAFIENRPAFEEIGRKAIAITLLKCENSERLFRGKEPYHHFEKMRDMERPARWYDLLWSHLASPFSFEDFNKNELSIITFNYDRSLEHFLFSALKRSSDRPDVDCLRAIKGIPIVHVYGSLGPLPWQDSDGVPYDSNGSPKWVEVSHKFIRLVRANEEAELSPECEDAQSLLDKAVRVFILGFGFDYTNIRRLRLDEHLVSTEVWATSLGLSRTAREVIAKAPVKRKRRGTEGVHSILNGSNLKDKTVYELLHDEVTIY